MRFPTIRYVRPGSDQPSHRHKYFMAFKLLTDQHLEFLSLNEATQAQMSLHLSKCHTVGNHMARLNFFSKRLYKPQKLNKKVKYHGTMTASVLCCSYVTKSNFLAMLPFKSEKENFKIYNIPILQLACSATDFRWKPNTRGPLSEH